MTQSRRAWIGRFVATLEARLDLYARIGLRREGEAVIVASLQHVVARHRAQLDASIAADLVPAVAPTARVPDRTATAWSHPVFWANGEFDPFAGTWADRMEASAATCRKLGYDAAAQSFEAHASDPQTAIAPAGAIDEVAQLQLAAIMPFVAGPQLALFA
ncbi:hypothetical protein ACFSGX_03905 [Sphingomonas arantia]|uniref:Uncharacterized protein n=1 Tax=Sphingomonas arantia TaxID=1460676 RepID=A0ABW4TXE2_9SPHN